MATPTIASKFTILVAHAHDHGAFWIEELVALDDPRWIARTHTLRRRFVPLGRRSPPRRLHRLLGGGGVLSGFSCAVRPHHFGTLLGLVANAHLVAAAGGTLLEYPIFEDDPALDADDDPGMYPFPLAFDVLDNELNIDDGRLSVPNGPGLGVDLDLDVVDSYPYTEGPWTEFVYDE